MLRSFASSSVLPIKSVEPATPSPFPSSESATSFPLPIPVVLSSSSGSSYHNQSGIEISSDDTREQRPRYPPIHSQSPLSLTILAMPQNDSPKGDTNQMDAGSDEREFEDIAVGRACARLAMNHSPPGFTTRSSHSYICGNYTVSIETQSSRQYICLQLVQYLQVSYRMVLSMRLKKVFRWHVSSSRMVMFPGPKMVENTSGKLPKA